MRILRCRKGRFVRQKELSWPHDVGTPNTTLASILNAEAKRGSVDRDAVWVYRETRPLPEEVYMTIPESFHLLRRNVLIEGIHVRDAAEKLFIRLEFQHDFSVELGAVHRLILALNIALNRDRIFVCPTLYSARRSTSPFPCIPTDSIAVSQRRPAIAC